MKSHTKIAILSSASGGGAGIAAKRMCDALSQLEEYSADFIDIAATCEVLPDTVTLTESASNRVFTDTHFTAENTGFVRGWIVSLLSNYDVINVHWASYLVTTSELIALAKKGKKILITMHDFYYSTGGCHYQAGCTGQLFSCIGCPQVDTRYFPYTSVMAAYREKVELLSYGNVHISAPSKYLLDAVVNTGIIHPASTHLIRNIYTAEDQDFTDKQAVKSHIILIADSLSEKRKGMSLAIAALALANSKYDGEIIVHLVGHANDDLRRLCTEFRINAIFHGRIVEHGQLVALYRNAGMLLTCSYEDNWPNILVEAGAYGVVPVVGSGHGCEEFCRFFNIGSIVDNYTPNSFAAEILNCIELYPSNEILHQFSVAVRNTHRATDVISTYTDVISKIPTSECSFIKLNDFCKDMSVFSENFKEFSRLHGIVRLEPIKAGPFSSQSLEFSGYGFASLTTTQVTKL
ncbi:glycosyltransferase [Methylobacter sp.]|uniref:glycosyltransferase n=1 Tax=Methylobacter sp. TaxID=2051955 RepID=UPI002FDDAC4C